MRLFHPSGYSTDEYAKLVIELAYTSKYALIQTPDGYTVIRNSDKMGLPLVKGEVAKNWAIKLKESDKFNSTNDYEFKTCDELTDYSYLFNAKNIQS